jgi:DNA replication protein DnaC
MGKTEDYYISCGIKKSWHKKTLAEYRNDKQALKSVNEYLGKSKEALDRGVGLYLWGANGTGKSHLMNTAFIQLISEKYRVRVYTMDEIVDKFTSSWYSEEEKVELDRILRTIDFLGIDEFGKNVDENGKPKYLPDLVKRVMESVIRYRVQMCKPIWFASNTDPKFVKDVFSEDVASLLREGVIPVLVKGDDYRRKILSENKLRFT